MKDSCIYVPDDNVELQKIDGEYVYKVRLTEGNDEEQGDC